MLVRDFQPDWVSPPGRTISDLLQAKGETLDALARKLSLPGKEARELLAGKLPLSYELAEKLEAQVGASREFWLNREMHYRDTLGDLTRGLWDQVKFPVAEMCRFGWLDKFRRGDGDMAAVTRFLGIESGLDFFEKYGELSSALAFRRSAAYELKLGAVAAWFRAGQIAAMKLEIDEWRPSVFEQALIDFRRLTRERDPAVFLPQLIRSCASAGVALSIVRAPTGCPVSGATYFPSGSGRPLLILSFRHLSDDHFWFSFFHEAGHILLHGENYFIESSATPSDEREAEANLFAANLLVPPELREEMRRLPASRYDIVRFARKIGVAPGLVVGQLQHEGLLRHNQLNSLKRRYKWRASLETQ